MHNIKNSEKKKKISNEIKYKGMVSAAIPALGLLITISQLPREKKKKKRWHHLIIKKKSSH